MAAQDKHSGKTFHVTHLTQRVKGSKPTAWVNKFAQLQTQKAEMQACTRSEKSAAINALSHPPPRHDFPIFQIRSAGSSQIREHQLILHVHINASAPTNLSPSSERAHKYIYTLGDKICSSINYPPGLTPRQISRLTAHNCVSVCVQISAGNVPCAHSDLWWCLGSKYN